MARRVGKIPSKRASSIAQSGYLRAYLTIGNSSKLASGELASGAFRPTGVPKDQAIHYSNSQ